jgi:hypothetical protein
MFNDYPVANVRFAEEEALAARIYTDDLQEIGLRKGDDEVVLTVSHSNDPCAVARSVAKVRVGRADGRIRSLDLLGKDGNLIKSVQYDYQTNGDGSLLRRQEVLLPEMSVMVGFRGEGIRLTVAGETQRHTDLECVYHEGSRQCAVDYEPTYIHGRLLPLPVDVVVQNPTTKSISRCVHLSGFRATTLDRAQIRQAAEEFAHFGSGVKTCRQMLAKYWLKSVNEMGSDDQEILKTLRTRTKDVRLEGATVGEQLRHINTLLQLDWMLGDVDLLTEHYQEYLALLASHNLTNMLLTGGRHVIETTILWGYLDAADTLLRTWAERAASSCGVRSLIRFASSTIQSGRLWLPLTLMEKVIEEEPGSLDISFEAQSLRCVALHTLCGRLQQAELLKRELDIMEIGWVSRTMDSERLASAARASLTKAKASFGRLPGPNGQQKALMTQLTKYEKTGSRAY